MNTLQINGKTVRMTDEMVIDIEANMDIFNWMNFNLAASYDFEFPREGNEDIFYHAGDPDNDRNLFTRYNSAKIIRNNMVLYSGDFVLRESIDQDVYRGTFNSFPRVLEINLDKKLNEILSGTDATLYTNQEEVNTLNAAAQTFVKFPRIATFNTVLYNSYSTVTSTPRLHCFNMIELLQQVCTELGYNLVDMATATADDIHKIYIPGRVSPTDSDDITDYLPDMTFRTLVKTFVSLTAADFTPVPETGELIFLSYSRAINDPRVIDLSTKCYRWESEINETNGLQFEFSHGTAGDDYINDNPGSVVGDLQTEVADLNALPGSPAEGDYVFVKSENAYWRYGWLDETKDSRWHFYADETLSRTESTSEGGITTIQCPCYPLHKANYVLNVLKGDYILADNGSGKIRVHFTNLPTFTGLNAGDYVKLLGTDYEVWVEVTAFSSASAIYMDIDIDYPTSGELETYDNSTAYGANVRVVYDNSGTWEIYESNTSTTAGQDPVSTPGKWDIDEPAEEQDEMIISWRNTLDYVISVVDESLDQEDPTTDIPKLNEALKNRILFWHGEQQYATPVDNGTTDGATTANKLIQSGQNFTTTVAVGYLVKNTTDNTTAKVTAVDSDTQLSLDTDIMATGENYEIYQLYWQGTADNLDPEGNTITDFALRWNGPNNLVDNGPWQQPVNFINNKPRIIKAYAWLSEDEMVRITNSSVRKINVGPCTILLRKYKTRLGNMDNIFVQLEGYRL